MDAMKNMRNVALVGLVGLVLFLFNSPDWSATLVAGLIGITAAVLLVGMIDSLLRLRQQHQRQ